MAAISEREQSDALIKRQINIIAPGAAELLIRYRLRVGPLVVAPPIVATIVDDRLVLARPFGGDSLQKEHLEPALMMCTVISPRIQRPYELSVKWA